MDVKSRAARKEAMKNYIEVSKEDEDKLWPATVVEFDEHASEKAMLLRLSIDGGRQGVKKIRYYVGRDNEWRIDQLVESLAPEVAENGGKLPRLVGRKCLVKLVVVEDPGYPPKNDVAEMQPDPSGHLGKSAAPTEHATAESDFS